MMNLHKTPGELVFFKILKLMILLTASVLVIQTSYASSVTITTLPTLPGGSHFCSAQGINDNKEIVGGSLDGSGNFHAVLWQSGKIKDLGTHRGYNNSIALDINNNGQIVGYSNNASGNVHAVLWQNGMMTDLGTLPGSTYSGAYRINDCGAIVGECHNNNYTYPTLWTVT